MFLRNFGLSPNTRCYNQEDYALHSYSNENHVCMTVSVMQSFQFMTLRKCLESELADTMSSCPSTLTVSYVGEPENRKIFTKCYYDAQSCGRVGWDVYQA
jgi:hypothetical protein